ncbi:tetratricopeptide repeat protein, partial [Xanthovirga aplysinae]|uniref:type IX secretion system periplasmic lipoprotein PorW/SprE n=1 Tax=Xanthovirga aplysinae TaxID=2529853 RepID=UPI0012BD4D6D
SSNKKNIASKTYHNITAHYNAYFIANEEFNTIDQSLLDNRENNYNKVLTIFPPLDSTLIQSNKELLEEIIKKSSLPIQHHKNSKWVDYSYILVGKVRFYQADFDNAIKTFKYVNSNSENNDARHKALIWLMRTFIDYGEDSNAIAVSDFLKKESLSKENQKNWQLVRAYYYQRKEDWQNMREELVKVVPLLQKKAEKIQIFYILGQLFQEQGNDTDAYYYYKKCLRSNPPYEMSFNAQLNIAKAIQLAKAADLAHVRKYFKKLLKDPKNSDFQDKIYFEMAEIEVKNNNLDKGIDYYKSSARVSKRNNRQKAYSYLKLGQIYFDTLSNYRLAQNYYDSAVQVMPKEEEIYEETEKRQKILTDFVAQLTIIQTEDSLLNLAKMDSVSLVAFLNEEIEKEEEALRQQQEELAQQAANDNFIPNQGLNPFLEQSNSNGDGTWYFHNLNAINQGRAEFKRKWGNRTLEDFWRLSAKAPDSNADLASNEEALKEEEGQGRAEENKTNNRESKINALYQTIPFSEDSQKESLAKIETAYFRLGNIYNFDLLEKEKAIEAFQILLERFPQLENKDEVFYLLFLILKEQNNPSFEIYGNRLKEEFPESIYAKLVDNPNFKEENDKISREVEKIYEKAYALFTNHQLDEAEALTKNTLNEYPENNYTNHLLLLEIMISGKKEHFDKYKFELDRFIETHPESALIEYAQQLKEGYERYKKLEASLRIIPFSTDFEQKHIFVLIYPANNQLTDPLTEKLEQFLLTNNWDLKSGNLKLNKSLSMLILNEFDTKSGSESFFKAFNGTNSPLNGFKDLKFYNFVISKQNFNTFYQDKDFERYLEFFEQNYK